jgi:hypothetical protein
VVEIPLALFFRLLNFQIKKIAVEPKTPTFSAKILKAFADQIPLTFPVKMAAAGTSVAEFNFPSADSLVLSD